MTKLLAVFGATGQQGGSIVNHVLNDATLSKEYSIRALTRDVNSPRAQALASKGVEVAPADLSDTASLHAALQGVHTVFAFTNGIFGPDGKAKETAQGKAIGDAAVANKVSYLIFSTLPNVTTNSNGKYKNVAGFDAKADAEVYIRSLPIRSAFFAPGSFMQNYANVMAPRPDPDVEGGFMIARHVSPTTQLPLIDTVGDTGKFVGAILADPDEHEGKTFCAATKLYTLDEIAQIIGQSTGKSVRYKQIPEETFRKFLPAWADVLIEMMLYQQDFGYYGQDTEAKVKWAADNARGQVTTFEEFLKKNPLTLG